MTVLKAGNELITGETGIDDGVTAPQQPGLIPQQQQGERGGAPPGHAPERSQFRRRAPVPEEPRCPGTRTRPRTRKD
jgi:hypothetical protein